MVPTNKSNHQGPGAAGSLDGVPEKGTVEGRLKDVRIVNELRLLLQLKAWTVDGD